MKVKCLKCNQEKEDTEFMIDWPRVKLLTNLWCLCCRMWEKKYNKYVEKLRKDINNKLWLWK